MIARAGARCSAPRNSAPGSSTAAHRASASGADVVGVDHREVIDAARAGRQRHRYRAHAGELLDVGAQRQPRCRRQLSHQLQVRQPEGDRLDEDVQRGDAAGGHHLGHHLLHHRHPGVRGVALGDGVGQQRRRGRRLRDGDLQLAGEQERAHLPVARQPVAGLAFERRRAGGEHLLGQPRCLVEHLVVGGLAQGARRGLDPASAARDLLVGDAGELLLVLAPAPAGERQMGVAVDEPGQHGAARGVDRHLGDVVGRERGDPAVASGHVAGLEGLGGQLVSAQVLHVLPRRAQDLGGAVDRQRRRDAARRAATRWLTSARLGSGSSIGIFTPVLARGAQRLLIAGVGVTDDAQARDRR